MVRRLWLCWPLCAVFLAALAGCDGGSNPNPGMSSQERDSLEKQRDALQNLIDQRLRSPTPLTQQDKDEMARWGLRLNEVKNELALDGWGGGGMNSLP
jgi:hypothetical protein